MNKKVIALIATLAGLLLAVYFVFIKPELEMRELARETCDEIDGAMMLTVGPTLNKAAGKTERLGFDKSRLGEQMRVECPYLVDSLENWAADH